LENRDLLINLFNSLKKPLVTDKLLESELEFQIQQVYNIDDTCVVGGSAVSGRIHISGKNVQEFYLGPDRGRFIKVNVNSLQRQRCIVKNLQAGQTGTMALKFRDLQTGKWIEKPSLDFRIRRGQVLLSTLETPVSFWEFEVDLFVLSHPACLIPGHALKIFCGTIAQQAKVITIESSDTQNIIKSTKVEGLDDMNDLVKQLVKPPKKKRRTSDVVGLLPGLHGRVTFGFINESEYLSIGSTVVIRGSEIKCVGKIVSLRKQH
jgi:GTPase